MRRHIFLTALIGAGIVIAMFASFITTTNFAQGTTIEQSIEVSPPSQELEVDPGNTVTVKAKVRNKGTIPYTMNVRIEDFTASGEEGQVELVSQGPWAISSWSEVSPKQFSLEPETEQEVDVVIKVPEQNVGGGKYGAIVFSVEGKGNANAAGVSQEIASLFLLRVSGPIDENLKAIDFSAPGFLEFGPVPLTLRLHNVGNVHVKSTGIVSVMNVLGKKEADVVIPPTNIFPQAKRLVTANLDKKFLIGPYQAVAIIYYGTTNQSLTVYTPFFVFPVRIVAGIVILIALVFGIRKYLHGRKPKSHAKK